MNKDIIGIFGNSDDDKEEPYAFIKKLKLKT